MIADVLQTLLALQQIDRQLLALEKAKGDLPQRLSELKQNLEQATRKRDDARERYGQLERNRRALEGEVALARERKKKYETQLYSVKTNKEYDAITLEIETAEQEVDLGETRILTMLEEERKLQEETGAHDTTITQLQQQTQQQEAELAVLLEETRSQVEDLGRRRSELAHTLKPNLLRTYDRIQRSREGTAVVVLARGSCDGCGTRIPPQRMMEIRENREIYYCENCGRILVWLEEEHAVTV